MEFAEVTSGLLQMGATQKGCLQQATAIREYNIEGIMQATWKKVTTEIVGNSENILHENQLLTRFCLILEEVIK